MQAIAGEYGHGVWREGCEDEQRLHDPAQLPNRLPFRHVSIVRDMPVPFCVKLLERAPGRMEDDHFRDVAKSKSRAERTLPPFHIFGDIDACKRADAIEVTPKHRHVAGTGIAMPLDIELEAISEDALISGDGVELRIFRPPDTDVPPENRASW